MTEQRDLGSKGRGVRREEELKSIDEAKVETPETPLLVLKDEDGNYSELRLTGQQYRSLVQSGLMKTD